MTLHGPRLMLSRSAVALAALTVVALPSTLIASSHREAPGITATPKVDGTDLYMFMSYEPNRSGYVTLIANYYPFQDPWAGPNYFMLDPDARYRIHIDNNGDAAEDVTFEFRADNQLKDQKLAVGDKQVSIPLINSGPIAAANSDALNVVETYRVSVTRGGSTSALTNASNNSETFTKPVDNIGRKSIPDYAAYAAAHVYNVTVPGCDAPARMFVGQRKEPFAVNVGETFDLINLNPVGARDAEPNPLGRKNITSFAIEVRADCLTSGDEKVIGAWTTATLGGTQVSRLGMPLVNEVVIGLKDKDNFNASQPSGDTQFLDYVTNPTLPELIEVLFPSAPAPNNFPRNDLVAAFLTGIEGVNKPANVQPAEMLRLNTSIAPTAAGSQNSLGVLAGDNAGFPNGRRPGDDVVDIELRVAMGVLCTLNQPAVFGCAPGDAPAGTAAFTDGTPVSAADFDNAFPYLRTPIPGSPNEVNGVSGQ
jgi:hypothetical protein